LRRQRRDLDLGGEDMLGQCLFPGVYRFARRQGYFISAYQSQAISFLNRVVEAPVSPSFPLLARFRRRAPTRPD
jgi:hypothetical protein